MEVFHLAGITASEPLLETSEAIGFRSGRDAGEGEALSGGFGFQPRLQRGKW